MDKNNFSEIYKKYVMTAYSAAMQVVHNEADADDIAQETMVKLYLNIDALDEYKKYVMTAYSAAMQVVHNEADADDIAQETMVKLYLNIDALDEDRVEGWVRVAAKNLGIDYQRKAQRFDWNELDEDLRAEEMELPMLAEEEKQERNHFFREVMDALKDHDESGYYITREIKVHERSEKEVASEMGITIGNLRVKMTRTKKWLCQHFADKARERGFL